MEDAAFEFYEGLLAVTRTRRKTEALLHVDLVLDRLRLYIRSWFSHRLIAFCG